MREGRLYIRLRRMYTPILQIIEKMPLVSLVYRVWGKMSIRNQYYLLSAFLPSSVRGWTRGGVKIFRRLCSFENAQ
jgi:hypothetical protein